MLSINQKPNRKQEQISIRRVCPLPFDLPCKRQGVRGISNTKFAFYSFQLIGVHSGKDDVPFRTYQNIFHPGWTGRYLLKINFFWLLEFFLLLFHYLLKPNGICISCLRVGNIEPKEGAFTHYDWPPVSHDPQLKSSEGLWKKMSTLPASCTPLYSSVHAERIPY